MKNKLFMSWLSFNIPFFAIVLAGLFFGYVQLLFVDISYVTHIIAAIFIFALLKTGYEAYHESYQGQEFLSFVMEILIGLGFIGTVIGVIIGFSFVPDFNDTAKLQAFISQMLVGFSTELHSLLMGLIGALWLSIVQFAFLKYKK